MNALIVDHQNKTSGSTSINNDTNTESNPATNSTEGGEPFTKEETSSLSDLHSTTSAKDATIPPLYKAKDGGSTQKGGGGGGTTKTSSWDPAEKYTKMSSKLSSSLLNALSLFSSSSSSSSSWTALTTGPLGPWKGGKEFLTAQVQVIVVLAVAYIGNNWPYSYPRNANHNPTLFWVMNAALLIAAGLTWTHNAKASARGVQLLSRAQTEEWKGWMQWAFIMYHYYRMYAVYNEIRVFVSAYVWMTGFGNFLYFDKTKDFSLERAVSMWIRINYFPLLLSTFVNVPLELYYVVPLHTVGFFIAMATCYVSHGILQQGKFKLPVHKANGVAIVLCLLVHVVFYETPLVNLLKWFSDEYHFRFQSDKYSAWVGILSGFVWFKFKEFMQWCHGTAETSTPSTAPASSSTVPNGGGAGSGTDPLLTSVTQENAAVATAQVIAGPLAVLLPTSVAHQKHMALWAQRVGGVLLIGLWYGLFGHISDKYTYNPVHPYVFWMPVAGWLMLRNSSKYLTEAHAGAMEFFGRITLETYVLQFHVFMCNKVQHIPIVVPGAGPDGAGPIKFLNMLVCGALFVALAYWARQITVTTQTTGTELVGLCWKGQLWSYLKEPHGASESEHLHSSEHGSSSTNDKDTPTSVAAAASTTTTSSSGETKESV